MNLKLFTQLQGNSTTTLILRPRAVGSLEFFLISMSVSFSIIVSGECVGELPGETPLSFDVVLSSVTPLLDKGYEFRIEYKNGTLSFVEEMERFTVTPLCVEHLADSSIDIMQNFLTFSAKLDRQVSCAEKLEEAELKLKQLQASYKSSKILELSAPSSDPFGSPEDIDDTKVDNYYRPLIEAATTELEELRKHGNDQLLRQVDLKELRRIAAIAAKANTTVALCDNYAITSMGPVYVLQKLSCGVRAVPGKLLQRLLAEKDGVLYEDGDALVFNSISGKGRGRTVTTIFLQSYLPNIAVDSTIVTKGAVLEKYTINLRGLLSVLSAVGSKFDTMEFDMGAACVNLRNDKGELLKHGFDVEDAKTIELNKLLRGESAKDIVMSSIDVPKSVQKILPFFKEDFTIFVKSKKVILQSGSLYVVFGR